MRRLAAAVAFLTRLPIRVEFDAADVGRASAFFPAVGALVGAIQAGAAFLLAPHLPSLLVALIAVASGALVTGAMHFDGLADSADGCGGGRTRDDVLRIMRDHAIGTYGALALLFDVGAKIFAVAILIDRHAAVPALVVAGALSRWAPVVHGRLLPYARTEPGLGLALTGRVGALELLVATATAGGAAIFFGGARGAIAWAAVAVLTLLAAIYFFRRIGGVTGDTLGAVTELGETLVLILMIAA